MSDRPKSLRPRSVRPKRSEASKSFRAVSKILAADPGEMRVEALQTLAYQAILEAERDDDAAKLHAAVSHMAAQTSAAELAGDIRLLLGKYWPR